jgi:hypothetical protein
MKSFKNTINIYETSIVAIDLQLPACSRQLTWQAGFYFQKFPACQSLVRRAGTYETKK